MAYRRYLTHWFVLPAISVFIAIQATAEESQVVNTQAGTPPTQEEAARLFTAPEGFQVTLFAGEPDVQQPIALTTDERGRLWVAENYTYAEHPTNFNNELKDRVIILEDTDGDGRFDRRKVFWDQASKLTSVEVGHGGVWLLCAPQLLFIPDRNRDDVPDGPPQVVLDGWDDWPVRHNIVNGLKWGPDGWLYGRHGIQATSEVGKPGAPPSKREKLNCSIWRYHPSQEKFEVVCHGTTNSWGFDYDDYGQMFFINTVIGHLWHVLPGAHYQRMYGADFNPHLYQLIEQCADHFHWDTGEKWSDIRGGMSDTTSAAGGGHAHSGLMIYLGDNWPDKYRNSVFTLNFHGRRINRDILERENAGYTARHGEDLVFANNEWFRGLDLIYGPDGGVFVADWSDIGECHENDGVHRTSGRIYKIAYGKPEPHVSFDLSELSNEQLAKLQLSQNDWYVRQSRRLLAERSHRGEEMHDANRVFKKIFYDNSDATRNLRAMWCMHSTGAIGEAWLFEQLSHENEHLRLWAVRLLGDLDALSQETKAKLATMAHEESSGLVRLYLASAMQRLPLVDRWPIAEGLVTHTEDARDRSLPCMVWYGIEPAVPTDSSRAIELAIQSKIPLVRQYIARRLTSEIESQPEAVNNSLLAVAAKRDVQFHLDILRGMNQALRGWRQAPVPDAWETISRELEQSSDQDIRQELRQLGVIFGDGRALGELKDIVVDSTADAQSRRSAIQALLQDPTPMVFELLKSVFTDRALVNDAVRGFAYFDDPSIPDLILGRFDSFDPVGKSIAIDTLVARVSFARRLLNAVGNGTIAPTMISAFHARQMRSFNDENISHALEQVWGAVRESSAEKRNRINELQNVLNGDRLTKANPSAGRLLFEKTCSVCHTLYGQGANVAPDLTGGNRHNLNYLLENIVDPSAAVGKEFRASAITFTDGRVLTGMVVAETDRTLTVHTQQEVLVIDRGDVEQIAQQEVSFMPDGLLDQFNEDHIADLFAYLMSRSQVPIAAED